jgi:hypothetical protein
MRKLISPTNATSEDATTRLLQWPCKTMEANQGDAVEHDTCTGAASMRWVGRFV